MTIAASKIRHILFDYGNTLIPFGAEQARHCDLAVAKVLQECCGPLDMPRFLAQRAQDRVWPYRGEFRERELRDACVCLVEGLYQRQAQPDWIERMLAAKYQSFVDVVIAPPYVAGLLERLGRRYPLGLVSNYPDSAAIRATLERQGLAGYFQSVVVSADVGFVKPHPLPFRTAMAQLQAQPQTTLLVGDNWLGDVQGAKRLGMLAAHIVQYGQAEPFAPQPGDHQPDWVLQHLLELESNLL